MQHLHLLTGTDGHSRFEAVAVPATADGRGDPWQQLPSRLAA